MSFRGVATRTRVIAAGKQTEIPAGGAFVSVPEVRNTDPTVSSRPVCEMTITTEDGQVIRIEDVRAGDNYALTGSASRIVARNKTAAEIEIVTQSAAHRIVRDAPRLPIRSKPSFTPDGSPKVFADAIINLAGYTPYTANTDIIIAPSSLLSGLERVARTRLQISTGGGTVNWYLGKYPDTGFRLIDNENLVLENVTDLNVWADDPGGLLNWTLWTTGVLER